MDIIEVTARFDAEGRITPLEITWNERKLSITSTGRQWDAEDGRHILAMLPGDHTVELIFVPHEVRWYLRQVGPYRTYA